MTAPLSVHAQVRDLNINMNDSCNCCCFQWKRKAAPDTQVYVNAYGDVIKYDPKKVDDEQAALKRCVSNLSKIIGEMAVAREKDKAEILREINHRIVSLKEDAPKAITVDMIQKMITLVTTSSPKGK